MQFYLFSDGHLIEEPYALIDDGKDIFSVNFVVMLLVNGIFVQYILGKKSVPSKAFYSKRIKNIRTLQSTHFLFRGCGGNGRKSTFDPLYFCLLFPALPWHFLFLFQIDFFVSSHKMFSSHLKVEVKTEVPSCTCLSSILI